jgi:hypothetical protein
MGIFSRPTECPVYNYTPPDGCGLTWLRFLENVRRFYHQMPFSASTCVPHLELCKSRMNVKMSHAYMMSWAYVADLYNVLMGQKRR